MKKHSKKEETNLEELDYMTQQDFDLKSDYESIFKSDKKDELLKDLMKVDFSNLNRRKENSRGLEKLETHNNSIGYKSSDVEQGRKSRSRNQNLEQHTEFSMLNSKTAIEVERALNNFSEDINEAHSNTTSKQEKQSKSSKRRESFEKVIKESFDNRDQSGSSLLEDAEKIINFNNLNYELFDLQNLKSKIRKYGILIKQSNKIEDATDSLYKISALWENFQENLNIAKLRSFSKANAGMNYEYETRLDNYSEIRYEVYKATVGLLDKNFLPELVKENGKLYFYKLNSFNLLNNLQIKANNNSLDELEKNFLDYLDESDFYEISSKIVELGIQRINFVRNSGFKDYYSYARIINLDYGQDINFLKEVLNNIKTYILPIYTIDFDASMDQFSKESENMVSDFYIDMDQEEFSEYYKNIFGELDWELRNLNDVFAYINENRIHQEYFPQTEIATTTLSDKKLIETLFYVTNRVIDRQSRGYLETLADLNYINIIDTNEFNSENNFLDILPVSKLFCMNLSLNNSMKAISNFIYLSGKAYSQLLRFRTKYNNQVSTTPTAESSHFIGTSMELMTVSRLNELFDDVNARKFKKWRLRMLLLSVINKCFLIDFEIQFYELLDDVMKSPFIDETEYRLILDMLVKKTNELWEYLLKEYRLTHYYEDKNFLKENVGKYLVEEPFTALNMANAELASIFIMLEFEEDRAKARYDFERFCAISGQSLFDEELNLAEIDDPMDLDNLKSLAFAIVDILENLEAEESEHNQ